MSADGSRTGGKPPVPGSLIADWCERWLGAGVSETLFEAGYVSSVVGLRLSDQRLVVLKLRPPAGRLLGCVAVQRTLSRAGFPCPRPLIGPVTAGALAVTAEELITGGAVRRRPARAAPFAALLRELTRLAPAAGQVPTVRPSPPWAGWDHGGRRIWPDAGGGEFDLNRDSGLPWLDRLADAVRRRLISAALPCVIGHGDWESKNIWWDGSRPVAVHDWDSVVCQPEAAIAGAAAATWPIADSLAETATIAETAEFLDGYQGVLGRRWTTEELQVCWAAGLWVRAYNVTKAVAEGDNVLVGAFVRELPERARRAGIMRRHWEPE